MRGVQPDRLSRQQEGYAAVVPETLGRKNRTQKPQSPDACTTRRGALSYMDHLDVRVSMPVPFERES